MSKAINKILNLLTKFTTMSRIATLTKGSDGYFLIQAFENDGETLINLEALEKLEVYAYVNKSQVAKFNRDGSGDFLKLNKISSEAYQYWVRGEDNKLMDDGDLKLMIVAGQTETTLEDNSADAIGEGKIYNLVSPTINIS